MAAVDAARVASIARKEVRHILRDPFTLAFALGIPVILLTFFGFVIDLNVKDVRLSVRDSDKTRISRQLAEVFAGSAYFRLLPPMFFGDSVRELDTGKASGVLIIHPEFGKRLASGKEARRSSWWMERTIQRRPSSWAISPASDRPRSISFRLSPCRSPSK